jgi:FkbM family methyltransferase
MPVRNWIGQILTRSGRAVKLWQNLGPLGAGLYKAQQLRLRYRPPLEPIWLSSKSLVHPVKCRPRTSDFDVFCQVFAHRQYRCLDGVENPGLIIDCGANVGYSAAYFLSRFPTATVIAVEPDPANFQVLQTNVAPYGARCTTLSTGVWSTPAALVPGDQPFRDGREWARTVRAAKKGEQATMTAVDIGTLLSGSGADRISILKVDIEGSETEVFSKNYEGWIGKVDNLVIEIHDQAARAAVMKAISGREFTTSRCDELFVCRSSPRRPGESR